MERLTEDSVTGETYIKHCASSCPYDGDFCGTDECQVLNAVADKLGEYERAEEHGLLVKLPCKVGDTAFRINEGAKNPIIELTVTQINIIRKSYNLEVADRDGGELMYFKNDIGNSIFLIREEAEKKLEEMKK